MEAAVKGEHWDTVITSEKKLFDLRLKEVWEYKTLIYMFIKRDFVVTYKQTILGPLWYLVQPIFSSIMYTFVFGQLANIGTDGIPHLLFYFAGTMLWAYFSSTLLVCSNTFLTNQNIFGKVYFPRLTAPIATVVNEAFKLFIQFCLLMCFYGYYLYKGAPIRPSVFVLLFPLIVLWIGILGGSLGLIISSLTTKYRDLVIILNFGMQLAMYATPVVYPISQAPEKFKWVFYINPMSTPIELFRTFFYGVGSVDVNMLLISLVETIFFVFIGLVLFTRNERNFVDVI